MMFTKNKVVYAVALSLLPFMNSAMADDPAGSSIEIQFSGQVKAPTCTIDDSTTVHSVTLPEIKLDKIAALSTGDATADQQQRFQLNVDCASKATSDDITLTIEGQNNSDTPEVLTNTSTDNDSAQGVGFELFTESNASSPLLVNGGEVPAGDYMDRLNGGNGNINFIVEYAKQGETVTAGKVTSSATFAFTYK